MLSFESGIPLAHIIKAQRYNNSRRIKPEQEHDCVDEGGGINVPKKKKKRKKRRKKVKILKTIYVQTDCDDDDEPELSTKNPAEIIDKYDLQKVKEKFKLNRHHVNQLKE